MALRGPSHAEGRRGRLSAGHEAAGQEGMSGASSNNMQSDLYKVELRWHDLLDLEHHFTSAAVSLPQGEDGVNMHFLTGDR